MRDAAPRRVPAPKRLARAAAGLAAAALSALLLIGASGCGKSALTIANGSGEPVTTPGEHGAAALATKNTTRLGGSEPAGDAAAVALAVYPGLTAATRPQAVVLVNESNWAAALCASTLAGWPLHAPLLYTNAHGLPTVSTSALAAMRPTGAISIEGAQAIAIGNAATPSGYENRALRTSEPAALAVSIEQLASSLRKRNPSRVIVTALDAPPAMTMPAAGLAAESGTSILLVEHDRVPRTTAAELGRLGRPSMYIVGPTTVVSAQVEQELKGLGTVTRIDGGGDPAGNSVALARYSDGNFGWGAVEPGHGIVFANAQRPLDGPAAAALAATGDYAPLLVLESAHALPASVTSYLSDLQPGTPPTGPVHGVYNHGWLIGDESAISAITQARIDAILEISPRPASEAEAGA